MPNRADNQTRQPFWKWQYDPLAKWRSGEFVEPEPGARKRYLLRTVLPLSVLALIVVYLKSWLNGWMSAWADANSASLDHLAKTDPLAAAEKAAASLKWMGWSLSAVLAILAVWIILFGIRERRAGRSPLPGTKVIRRTEIIHGPLLKLRTGFILLMGAIALSIAMYCGTSLHLIANENLAESIEYLNKKKTGKTPAGHSAGQSVRAVRN